MAGGSPSRSDSRSGETDRTGRKCLSPIYVSRAASYNYMPSLQLALASRRGYNAAAGSSLLVGRDVEFLSTGRDLYEQFLELA